jgi:ABC-type uncharacterized transport system substrate-binding protein
MSVRRLAVATCWLLAVSLTAEAQPPKVPTIGVLSLEFPDKSGCVDRVRRGLDDLGYVEGRTHILELRWAKDRVDLLPSLVADLVRINVDVIVSASAPAAGVVKEATTSVVVRVMRTTAGPDMEDVNARGVRKRFWLSRATPRSPARRRRFP